MRLFLCFFSLVSIAVAAPNSSFTNERIREIFEAETNMDAARLIVEEEATRLGVTAEYHLKTCENYYSDSFKLIDLEKRQILEEFEAKLENLKMEPLVFNNTESIMPVLKVRTPRLHAALRIRFDLSKIYVTRIDEESKDFLLRTAETIAEEIVVLSKTNFTFSRKNLWDHVSTLDKPLKRIFTDYKTLPQASKDVLDKTFCFTTSLRILDKDGKTRQFLEEVAGVASTRQEKILEIFGNDIDEVAADKIIEEEAAELGVTADEHFKVCEANFIKFNFTKEEEDDYELESESIDMSTIVFNNTDEVMSELKVRAPKTHAAIVKRLEMIETYIGKVDPASQKFIRSVGTVILDAIVGMSKKSTDEPDNRREYLAKFVKATTQILADYYALPDESKKNIERTTCVRTSFHIINKDGRFTKVFLLVASAAQLLP